MDSLQYSYEPTLDKGKWSQSSIYEGTEAEEILLLQFGFPEFDDQFIVKFKGEIQNIAKYVQSSNFDSWVEMKKSRLSKTWLEKKK